MTTSITAKKAKAGFTLVELLIVISVIGVLAGLTLPLVSKLRSHAEQTACAASMSQFAQGIQGFANNNDGSLPTQYQIRGEKAGFTQYMNFGSDGGSDTGFYRSTTTKCPTLVKYYLQFPGNNGTIGAAGSTHAGIGDSGAGQYQRNVSYSFSTSVRLDIGSAGISHTNQILDQTREALMFCGDATWNTANGVDYAGIGLAGPQFPHKTKKTFGNNNSNGWDYHAIYATYYPCPVIRDGFTNILHADGHVSSKKFSAATGPYDENKFLSVILTGTGSSDIITAGNLLGTASRRSFQYCWNAVGADATTNPMLAWVTNL
jgi:prepilin-type N-terminal cleavage/methylation domain-containing protein/prepilin-type processing-associated H-X9-DG protein